MIHTKLRQHLTFQYSVFASFLELDLAASALSSTSLSFVASLLQDHPGASFCMDLIGRLCRCPSAFPMSLLAGPLPQKDETQANAPAELAACAALRSVLCLVGLSSSWWSITQAACMLLTLGNQDTAQRKHQAEQGCRCDCIVTTLKGVRSVPGDGYLGDFVLTPVSQS